ncbi:MAG: ATP-binding protein, partial [Cyanobacteria bacterium P01_H01_bin.121]
VAMIQTNLQATLATSEIEPQQRQQLQLIERLTQRLGRLVDNLLFLARQDSGIAQVQKTQVLLDEVLLEVLEEQMTPAATKQITLDFQLPEQPELHDRDFAVWGDRDQLIRLFTNLVSNALQYTPMSGQVTVQLGLGTNQKMTYPKSSGQKFSGQKTTSHNNPAQRPPQAGSETIQIKIRDTGIGIQADSLPHIFERFYRVDPARSSRPNAEISGSTSNGTGLGLAIAQSIVQTHQGMIQIQSELEHGTCVSVTLPLLPQAQVDSLIQISPD